MPLDLPLDVGKAVGDSILYCARLLRAEEAPGLVSLVLLLCLLGALTWYLLFDSRRILEALREARSQLDARSGPYREDRFLEIQESFKKWEGQPSGSPRHRLAEAWREFGETVNRQKGLFNTVRPSEFFDRGPLHMAHRFFAQLPALFVSVGLFLTFLGLVAALDQTREILQTTASAGEGLRTLLQVAGAKFIMSLTGLFCSILFGLVFRTREGRVDEALHALCAEVERGFEYRSADSYLLDQILEVLREQGTHLQALSTEMVAQIAQPLREEIPQALRESIQEAMAPSLEQFERGAGQGLESMVASVTTSMSGTVQDSAQALNDTMQRVGGTLEEVASRLDRSAESMGGQVGHAVAALSGEISSLQAAMAESSREATDNLSRGARGLLESMEEALRAIRDSSQTGADGIDRAATAMTDAVETLTSRTEEASLAAVEASSKTIDEASRRAAEGLGESARTVTREMSEMSARITSRVEGVSSALDAGVLQNLRELTDSIDRLNNQMAKSADRVRRYAETVETGAKDMAAASHALSDSSDIFRQTAAPIRSAVEGIVASNRLTEQKVTATASALESGARDMTNHVVAILKATESTIESASSAAADTRGSIESTLREFEALVARFTGLDQRLGDAWKRLGEDVGTSLSEFHRFERELNERFAESLDKLREVADQMEPFQPVPDGTGTSPAAAPQP